MWILSTRSKRFSLIFFSLLFPSICHATPSYNLDQLIDLALSSRPEKKIVESQISEAESTVKIAKSYYYPQLNLNMDFTYLDEKPYAVIPETTFNATVDLQQAKRDYPILAGLPDSINMPLTVPLTRFDVGGQELFKIRTELLQPVFTGGKIKERLNQAKHMVGITKKQEEKTDQEIIFQVKSLYFKLVFADMSLSALHAAERRLNVIEKFLDNLYRSYVPKEGERGVTRSDYLEARVSNFRIKKYASEAERIKQEAKEALAIACGLENSNFSVSKNIEKYVFKPPTNDLEALKKLATETRPESKQLILSENISSSEIKRAKAGYYPDIGLFGYYQHIEDNFPTADENVFAAGIGASIPIFNGMRTSGEVKKAKAMHRRVKSQQELFNLKVSLEVEELYAKIADCKRKIAINSKALSDARQRRQLESESYLLDPTKYDDYVESIEDEVEAEVSLYRAKGEYYVALASLQLACGL